jgi:hypothetical protein
VVQHPQVGLGVHPPHPAEPGHGHPERISTHPVSLPHFRPGDQRTSWPTSSRPGWSTSA